MGAPTTDDNKDKKFATSMKYEGSPTSCDICTESLCVMCDV